MKIQLANFLVAKSWIILIVFIGYCACACDVYFWNEHEIVCITDNNTNYGQYEDLYKKLMSRCPGTEVQHSDIPKYQAGGKFLSIDCTWEPRIFEKFTSSDVLNLYTGEQNPNKILQGYVFVGFCNTQWAMLKSANIESMEPDAFHCLKEIRQMDLSRNRIEILPASIFKEMKKIETLILSYNRIQTLEPGTFDNQQNLLELEIAGNQISSLPEGIFHRLVNLRHLDLFANQLEYLGRFPFGNMTRLRQMSFKQNKLKSLEKVFLHNIGLEFADFSYNEIKSISKEVFIEAKHLTHIKLSSNRLEQVTPELFGELHFLQILNLSYNQITELKNEPFAKNHELGILDLKGNKLTEIKSGDLRGIPKLHTLYLGSNLIVNIAIDSFKNMPHLTALFLDSNLISAINTDAFNGSPFSNTSMTILNLSNNDLKNISNIFYNTSIINLDISSNSDLNLQSDTFTGMKHLQYLRIMDSNIESIPDGLFRNAPQIKGIDMSNNKIRTVTPDTFAFQKITSIDLGYNNIERLTNFTFKNCYGLIFLNVSHNNISKIERETFRGIDLSLKYLDLKSNFLSEVTFHVPSLTHLILNHNSIISLDGVLDVSQHLEFLDVTYNNLTNATIDQWRRILKIKKFSAVGNYISEVIIPEINNVFTKLDLRYNRIKKVNMPNDLERKYNENSTLDMEGNDISVSSKKIFIYLEGNPIECDCSAYKLNKYLLNFNINRNHILYFGDLICHNPIILRGKSLLKLKPMDLTCNYKDDTTYFQYNSPADDCLYNCSCLYRPHDGVRYVNCSNNNYEIPPRRVPEHTTLLDLNGNSLRSLANLKDLLWENLTEIHVESNAIELLDYDIPGNLTFLGLKDNKLKTFPDSIRAHAKVKKEFRVTLSRNLFVCDCSAVPLKEFLLSHGDQVVDKEDITCESSSNSIMNMANITYVDLCPSETETINSVAVYIVFGIVLIISIAFSVIYYNFKLYIFSFLYTHCNCCYRLFCCSKQIKEHKIFDAFIAYSSDDGEVALTIAQELEPQYQFCIHERNWMPGTLITNNIIYSVRNSRKVLVVLSETFLASKWFHLEFQAAFNQALWDKTDRLIMIVKGKLPDSSLLPDDVKYVLKTKTYLEWGEKWFFEKLRYAMQEQKPFIFPEKSSRFSRLFNRFRSQKFETQQDIQLQNDIDVNSCKSN